jgi:hypothetical protein
MISKRHRNDGDYENEENDLIAEGWISDFLVKDNYAQLRPPVQPDGGLRLDWIVNCGISQEGTSSVFANE